MIHLFVLLPNISRIITVFRPVGKFWNVYVFLWAGNLNDAREKCIFYRLLFNSRLVASNSMARHSISIIRIIHFIFIVFACISLAFNCESALRCRKTKVPPRKNWLPRRRYQVFRTTNSRLPSSPNHRLRSPNWTNRTRSTVATVWSHLIPIPSRPPHNLRRRYPRPGR